VSRGTFGKPFWITLVFVCLVKLLFVVTYPLNVSGDGFTYFRMIATRSSNLAHAGGYPFLVGLPLAIPRAVLAGLRERVPIQAHAVNVENVDLLTRTLRGFDVAVNATLPKYNLTIMRACLDAGVGYLDTSAAGPSRPGGPLGIFEQLELDDAFRSAGVTALLSMGLDPGMTNVLAREASEALDRIDAIRIRSCSTAKLPGFENFPLYSREAFLSDILIPPTVWDDGALREREPRELHDLHSFDAAPVIGRPCAGRPRRNWQEHPPVREQRPPARSPVL